MKTPTITISLPYQHSSEDLLRAIHQHLGRGVEYRIVKRSLDARNHRNIVVQYSVQAKGEDPCIAIMEGMEEQRKRLEVALRGQEPRLAIVGTGPGGLFCAWWLVLHGIRPILIEQGPPMRQRVRDMALFMKTGLLNPLSNICFGAGGAGTYSDGKLITRIRSPFIPFVMKTFVDFGAPEEILTLYNPHLGSNRIRQCILRMLEHFEKSDMTVRYHTQWVGMKPGRGEGFGDIDTNNGSIKDLDALFAATGHSSRVSYDILRTENVSMEAKEFAVGIRVEHSADFINRLMYGEEYRDRYPGIETAQYKFARTWKDREQGVYSFCMCPGGYVLNASTDTDGIVTNGMSNSQKSGRFSNAAVVATVSLRDLDDLGFHGVDAGLHFQRQIEEDFRGSVNAAGCAHIVPAQRLRDFLQGTNTRVLGPGSCLNPSSPAPLHRLFPTRLYEGLRRGLTTLNGPMRHFADLDTAQAFGVESRTSSPYRVPRDPITLQSCSHPWLYPMGEGAGQAGGITSAAVDGIRCAQAWIASRIEPWSFTPRHDSIPEDLSQEVS